LSFAFVLENVISYKKKHENFILFDEDCKNLEKTE